MNGVARSHPKNPSTYDPIIQVGDAVLVVGDTALKRGTVVQVQVKEENGGSSAFDAKIGKRICRLSPFAAGVFILPKAVPPTARVFAQQYRLFVIRDFQMDRPGRYGFISQDDYSTVTAEQRTIDKATLIFDVQRGFTSDVLSIGDGGVYVVVGGKHIAPPDDLEPLY